MSCFFLCFLICTHTLFSAWLPFYFVCSQYWPSLLQRWSFKTHFMTFLTCIKFSDFLIFRIKNCERAGRDTMQQEKSASVMAISISIATDIFYEEIHRLSSQPARDKFILLFYYWILARQCDQKALHTLFVFGGISIFLCVYWATALNRFHGLLRQIDKGTGEIIMIVSTIYALNTFFEGTYRRNMPTSKVKLRREMWLYLCGMWFADSCVQA